jgi:hypothetical protein
MRRRARVRRARLCAVRRASTLSCSTPPATLRDDTPAPRNTRRANNSRDHESRTATTIYTSDTARAHNTGQPWNTHRDNNLRQLVRFPESANYKRTRICP